MLKYVVNQILTLLCPFCKKAFLDFNGCCAVTCNCNQHFCGLCLTKSNNSEVCHSHVRSCYLNPNHGDYFCSQDQLDKVHRETRIRQLNDYLRSIPPESKRPLLRNCEPYLKDLGIYLTDLEV